MGATGGFGLLSMMGNPFDRFLANIRPTKSQREDAQTKAESVASCLRTAYYPNQSIAVATIVGSHGKGTAVRPVNDVDVLFFLPESVKQRFFAGSGNRPSQLLQEVKSVMRSRFPNTDLRGDGQVVVAPFESLKVELAPVLSYAPGKFYLPDTNGGGKWKVIEPDAETSQIELYDKLYSGRCRHLIMMTKVWRRNCNVPIKNVAIDLLVPRFLASYKPRLTGTDDYGIMMAEFFALLKVCGWWTNLAMPGTGEVIWLDNAFVSRAESAHERAVRAVQFERVRFDSASAREEWQKIFGPMFAG